MSSAPGAQLTFHDPERAEAHAHLLDALVERLQRHTWSEVPCVVCGEAEDLPVAFEKHGVKIRRCGGCSHLFVSPRLPDEAVPELYSSAYWDDYMRAIGSPTLAERVPFDYQNGWAKLRRDILPWRSGGRLLEVGASNGGLVKAADEAGFDAVGIEPAEEICALARRMHGVDMRCTTLPEAGFEPESFDVIAYYDVLEHLFDPRRELEEVRRVIAPGGLLVIETLTSASLKLIEEGENWFLLNPVEHVHFFDEGNGALLAEQCGLRVLDLYCPHEDNWILIAEPA